MVKYAVIQRDWDHNGTFTVQVSAPWPRTATTDQGARRAARRSDPMQAVKRTRIVDVVYRPKVGLVYTVLATRLEAS